MNNYFSNVRVQHKGLGNFPIRWENWSPERIYFKSNSLTKKLLPSENIISYKSKRDRDQKTAELTGGKFINSGQYAYYSNEKHKAVHVQMKDFKSEYVTANVDFIDQTGRKDSVGNNKGRLDVLCYISSRLGNGFVIPQQVSIQRSITKTNAHSMRVMLLLMEVKVKTTECQPMNGMNGWI